MAPFKFSVSPAVAELVVKGQITRDGVAATFIRLASQGLLTVLELEKGHAVRVAMSEKNVTLSLNQNEMLLLDWFKNTVTTPQKVDFHRWWGQWQGSVGSQSQIEGILTKTEWDRLKKWLGFPIIPRRFFVRTKRAPLKTAADLLRDYPHPTDSLPENRSEWDELLSYAVALGQSGTFLRNVRRVCEHFERHLQGIVMTFYTPYWYRHERPAGEDRFSFLTSGLTDFLSNFVLTHVKLEGEGVKD